MGLTASWRLSGHKVAVFKKGPDYIDAAWLEFASGTRARNLDTYMMGREGVMDSFQRNCPDADLCLIEGNRGLFDGADKAGTHSTAELAKLLKAPVILVKDVTKVTRTAAVEILGCLKMDPDLNLAGVILNRVAGSRHERVVRESIESICGIPVFGAIPKLVNEKLLPGRHLGLITPSEHPELKGIGEKTAEIIDKYTDVNRITKLAETSPVLNSDSQSIESHSAPREAVRIAYFSDSAFTFYYQDNLDALQAAGAELIPVSSLESPLLPRCDGLYIGGGFPETHAERLSLNRSLIESVKNNIEGGLPVYAECGGLIYLCRSITYRGKSFSFSDVFPVDLEMITKPQGHGYMEVEVDAENPFFPQKTIIRGHEFHYSRIAKGGENILSAYKVKRGVGCSNKRDGLVYKNVLASYLHIHTGGAPGWAENFVKKARDLKVRK